MDVAHTKDKKTLRNACWLQSYRSVNVNLGGHRRISPQWKEMNGYTSLQTASISALLPAVIKVQGYKQNNTQLLSGQKDKACKYT